MKQRLKKALIIVSIFLCAILCVGNAEVFAAYDYGVSDSFYKSDRYKNAKKAIIKQIKKCETEIDISKYKFTSKECNALMHEIENNPEVNFLIHYLTDSKYNVNTKIVERVKPSYKYDKATCKKMVKAYDKEINNFLEKAPSNMSDTEKALYACVYLVQHCEYYSGAYCGDTYGALVDNRAICQGYSSGYKALANALGLECEIVISKSRNHSWNMVKIDGKYYYVDATWVDTGIYTSYQINYTNFLKSTKYFKSEFSGHYKKNDWEVSGRWKASYANSTTYDDFFWDDLWGNIRYANGYWYVYSAYDSSIVKYKCTGKKFEKTEDIIKIDIPNDKVFTYENLALGSINLPPSFQMDSYKNTLYYSIGDTIYKYDTKTKKTSTYYELTKSDLKKGIIYGLDVRADGTVYYTLVNGYFKPTKCKVKGSGTTVTKYNIAFHGNGATSGSMSKLKDKKYGTSYTLPANAFERTNYVFKGWNTKKDGSGTFYKDKASIKNLTKTNGKTVTLYAQWEKIGISDKTKTIYVGSSYTLKLTGTTIKSVSSSNKKVATVTSKGKVTAKKAGKATITLKGKNGKSYKCKVTVKKPYISDKKKTLSVGEQYKLKLTGTTIEAAVSSDEKVATVTSKGKIAAKKAGKTTITLKGKDGKKYKCIVTVQ